MNNYKNTNHNDEIDLFVLLSILWNGKIIIILFSIIGVLFASYYLRNVEKKYSFEYRIKPVSDSEQVPSYSGLGGIASIAGIQLPSNSSGDFKIFKELLTSVEVSQRIFSNRKLIKSIFSNEWDAEQKIFVKPKKNKKSIYISTIKKFLTGNSADKYIPPNPRRLAGLIAANVSFVEDQETGFLHIKGTSSSPEQMIRIIIELTQASDDILRERYIAFSKGPLEFYKEKIRTARSREHREALAQLIGKEEQKLMFASSGKYFVAEPYLKPIISLYHVTPKPKSVLIISFLSGLFVGLIFVLFRNFKKKENL
jgi:LPS O-antigen subunit length determinant protein (WzzB/FepE family)